MIEEEKDAIIFMVATMLLFVFPIRRMHTGNLHFLVNHEI